MHSARPIRLSIKQGLWLLAAGMAAALALIWILDQHYQRRITEDTALQSMTVDLSRQLQNLRQQMDDFASSRQMQHADSFRQGFKRLEQQHQQLIQGLEQAGFPVADMEAAGQHFQQVKADFEAVVTKQVEIGLDRQMGHAGDLNAAAARVSQVVAPHPELAVSLLSLRQHEKDFLLYRDERFINQFMVALSTLRGKMFMSDLDNRVLAATQQSLRAYTDSFNTMAQLQREIGLNSGTGLTGKLNAAANQAEQRFTALAQQLNQHLQGRLNDARVQSTLSVITIMCLMLTSLGLVIRQLNRHFSHAQGQAQRLREGDLETPIEQIPGNEIGDLLLTLEGMRLGLVEKNEAMAKEHRTQTRLSELSSVFQGVKNTDALCEQVLGYLCNTFKAHIGTLYTYRDGELQCRASYGIADLEHRVHRIMAGEGIAGQCVVDRRQMTLRNLPADYLMISTGSLRTRPGTLLVTPLLWNEKVYGVVEIAASGPLPDEAAGFLQQASETIAIAVNTALVNADLAHTLRESQRQEERLRASEAALHSRQEAQQSMNEEQASHRRQPHYDLSHQ